MSRCSRRYLGGLLVMVSCLLLAPSGGRAQTFNSGSTGANGPFNPASNTTLALPPSGVFNFTTINIPSGVTVTLTRNAANTPAILLASGDVTISGTLSVNGSAGGALNRPGAAGPGGFDGGAGADGVTTAAGGAGLGPGGGSAPGGYCGGTGGSYGTAGTGAMGGCGAPGTPALPYGSPLLRPILGGSGGSGASLNSIPSGAVGGGGGGGGALLIASSGTLTLSSGAQLLADGGVGGGYPGGGAGSGGAIRLIATTIASAGNLFARGAAGVGFGGSGGLGRIRLEAYTLTVSGGTRSPEPTQGFPQPVFPGTGQPTLTIASIGGVAAPATPSGSFLAAPDIVLPTGTTNPVAVALTASNIPLGTVIQVTATPQSGSKTTAVSSGLAGTVASSTATASLTLSLTQTNVLTATRPSRWWQVRKEDPSTPRDLSRVWSRERR